MQHATLVCQKSTRPTRIKDRQHAGVWHHALVRLRRGSAISSRGMICSDRDMPQNDACCCPSMVFDKPRACGVSNAH